MIRAFESLDVGVEIRCRLGVAEITPGARVFAAVDGVVERFQHRLGAGAVVQIGLVRSRRGRGRQRGERADRHRGEGMVHRESPLGPSDTA